MKKTILFALIVVGLTVSFFEGHLASQERRAAIPTPKRITITYDSLSLKAGIVQLTPLLEDRVSKTQRLRNEIQRLFQKRLQTMSDDELIVGIDRLRKEFEVHESNVKLQQAKTLLQEILKTYPKSQAAKQARKMLDSQRGEEAGDAEADPAATANEADKPTTE